MKNKLFLLLFLFAGTYSANAQLSFIFSSEAGFGGSTVKTKELPVFLASYNEVNTGLSKPFEMKQGMATGTYFHFMVGMGGEKTKMTLGFGRYLVTTSPNQARYADGTGRDISTEIKDASTEVGIRTDFKKLTVGFNLVISLRTVSIYSEYVFADGSKSMGFDHSLNGVYDNFSFGPGLGFNVGYQVLPKIYIVAKADYIFASDKSHPEYKQFMDLQDFRTFIPDYLPRDVNEYANNPFNGIDNSISNDIKGLRFGIGIQVCFSTITDL